MPYEVNPLYKEGLQKKTIIPDPPTIDDELSTTSTNAVQNRVITTEINKMKQDTTKKVSKFFTSIEELEIGEIGEYQGETNETFTNGYFYRKGKDGVDVVFGESVTTTITQDINFYRNGSLITTQAFVMSLAEYGSLYNRASFNPNVVCHFFKKGYFYSDILVEYDDSYLLYPYAYNCDTDSFDTENPLSVSNESVLYKGSQLSFYSYELGETNAPIAIDKNTKIKYVWFIASTGWRYALPISEDGKCAYITDYSIFESANDYTLVDVVPYSLTYKEYTFAEGVSVTRIDTQPALDPSNFATSAQGALADTAVQDIEHGTDGSYITTTVTAKDANKKQKVSASLTVQPLATADTDHKGIAESSDVKSYIATNTATKTQGGKADSALQSISHGTDGDYITTTIGAKDANNSQSVSSTLKIQPMLTADDSHKGVAESSDVKKWFTTYIPYNPIYGVMWDTENPSPDCIRIGNLDLHATLPVHSQMIGGTLDDNAVFTPFNNQSDWTGETSDGSAGQVMMRFPEKFWYKFITEGTINKVLVSAQEVSGFQVFAPGHYMSAYKATLQRSTLKLSSVVNLDPDYRGGNNTADWDNTYRSLLGKPVSNVSLTNFRAYARARWGNNQGNCAVYYLRKMLYWLFVTEYATLNTQKEYNAALDANGYRQGGLGAGVTDWNSNDWYSYNGYNPLIPCGYTDQYGNQTAQKSYDVIASDGVSIAHSFFVPRYRGIESPFGDIGDWMDGILINKQAADSGGKSPVYVTNDPSKFSSSDFSQYDYLCDEIRTENFIKGIHFGDNGDIVCVSVPGSSTQYYCDWWYGANLPTNGTSLRGVRFGGSAHNGARAGFVFGYSNHVPAYANPRIGSRLCFLPSS